MNVIEHDVSRRGDVEAPRFVGLQISLDNHSRNRLGALPQICVQPVFSSSLRLEENHAGIDPLLAVGH